MLSRLLLMLAAVSPTFAACTFTLSPVSASFGYTSNDGTITVTASATNCARAAASNSAWITISLGQSGTGDGTVGYTVSQNNTTASRTGSLTVAGIAFNVTQAGAQCSYSLSPNNASVAAAGASGTFNVSTACSWTATSNADWISTSDAGTGNGAIHYTAAPNTGGSRTGTISVGTQTFTVTQAAACNFTTTPVSAQADPNGASGTFTVTASANTCAWTATSNNPDFLTVTTGMSGTGNGTVGYTAASNVGGVARSGSISVGNAFFSLFQNAGAGCSISLSIGTASIPSTGGTGSFTVITNCPWTITSGADWVNVFPPATMTATASVAFSVTANTSAQARTAYIYINGLTFVIQQAGVPCTVSVAPASVGVAAGGGTGSIQVTAADGCNWSVASSSPAWLSVQPAGGSGSGGAVYTAAANTVSQVRKATITIANQVIAVTQDAADCSGAVLTPDHLSAPSNGGTFSFHISTSCDYSAVTNNGWIMIVNGSGTGSSDITYKLGQNTSTTARQGSINVAGLQFAVAQAGANSDVTITPQSGSVSARGGAGSVSVACPTACSWTPTADQGWITFTYASANGNGKIDYTVAANNSTSARTGNILIGGQVFQIAQAAMPLLQISAAGVVNGASFAGGAVAPGEIVTIFGSGVGPMPAFGAQLAADQRSITTMIGDTRILFDGVPAPMLYASATQASAIAPFEIAGKTSTQIQVEYQGFLSAAIQLDAAATSPAIFTLSGSGTGQGAILNQDGSVNGSAAPAAKGSIVALYATGGGQTNPASVDGRITTVPLPRVAGASVQIEGLDATVTYAGAAPGLPAGVLQVNVRVPLRVDSGAQPVVLKIGNGQSQAGVTVAIQ